MAGSGSGSVQVAVGVLCLLAFLSTCTADKYDIKNGRHNITLGQRRLYPNFPTDILLFNDNPTVAGSWFPYPQVQSHDVCYPPYNHPRVTLTAINVTDQVPKGEGGYAFLKSGGVNSGQVCLHLKTQRGKGYDFMIIIYGYYL